MLRCQNFPQCGCTADCIQKELQDHRRNVGNYSEEPTDEERLCWQAIISELRKDKQNINFLIKHYKITKR